MTVCVVSKNLIDQIKILGVSSGSLWGRVLDDGDTIHVVSATESAGLTLIGSWAGKDRFEDCHIESNTGLTMIVDPGNADQVRIAEHKDGNETPKLIVADVDRAFDRVKSVLDMDKFAGKRVLIVGAGSGGSRVALELAKSGVEVFDIVDNDRLEIENIMRHICGISDLGRFKTRAMKTMILEHNPRAKVFCHEFDVVADIDRLRHLVKGTNLVISATGSPKINNITNDLCAESKVPGIFAGVWEKASGGFVMRYIPGESPCFNCVHPIVTDLEPRSTKSIDYSTLEDTQQLTSEPGLSVDIGFISLLQSKLAILTLLGGTGPSDIPQHLIVWLNRAEGKYPAMTLLKANAKKRYNCLSCGELVVRSA